MPSMDETKACEMAAVELDRGCVSLTTQQSFDDLYRADFSKVVRLGYAMTRSDADAQDAAQHAFIVLFERWATVDNPAGFVRTVALNRLRDSTRHSMVRRRFLRNADRTEPAVTDPDYLADALSRLAPRRRAMVVLRFYEERTVAEIAEILEVPAGSVKSGLSRSMRQLRGELS